MATILITDTDNGIINKEFYYLLGFQPSLGGILIKKNSIYIFLDDRYFEQSNYLNKQKISHKSKKESIYFKNFKSSLIDNILIYCNNSTTLKLEESLNLKYFNEIKQKSNLLIYLNTKKIEIIEDYFKKRMILKNNSEITKIKKAKNIIENVFLEIQNLNKQNKLIGKTEIELKTIIKQNIINLGGEKESFNSIVAFGANSAIPHHQTGNTIIGNGPLLIDMGAIYNGYCSDFTRTIWVGNKNELYTEFKKIYNIVKKSHDLAANNIKIGICACELDDIARDYITKSGYGKYFTHSTGHGIGLNNHEAPFISKNSKEVIVKGMVFTIEPGIYISGKFGIRYENIYFVD